MPGHERGQLLVLGRREVAVGVHVLVVARRARLVRGRADLGAGDAVGDPPLAPERVHRPDRVAGHDVGQDVGGLAGHDPLAADLRVRRRPHLLALAVDDLEDRVARHHHAVVGDHPVRADHVDRVVHDGADAHRGNGGLGRGKHEPEVLHPLELVIEAVDETRLDRRDVERELEGVAHADGAALEAVCLGRIPGLGARRGEVGDDVHEHRGRRHGAVLDAHEVHERLDRRPGLPPAVAQDVELRLELLGAPRGVRRGPGVGEHLARAVVDDAARRVVDVVPAQALDPAPLAAGDAAILEDLVRVLQVGDDRRGVDPLLGDPLHLVVEGRRDLVAAGVDLLALVGRGPAQDLAQLLAHLPHEVRRAPLVGLLRGEDRRAPPWRPRSRRL